MENEKSTGNKFTVKDAAIIGIFCAVMFVVFMVYVRQPEFADLQLHQPHHWRFEGAGGHAAGGGQVHPDPAENPGSEYQDPSRKDGSGHQRHHREDHQTPALRLQAGGTVGADRQEPL